MGFLDELKDKASSALDAAKIVGEKAVEKGKDMAQQGKLGLGGFGVSIGAKGDGRNGGRELLQGISNDRFVTK